MKNNLGTILGCVATLALTAAGRAEDGTVRPARYDGPLQVLGGGHVEADGGPLYDNTMLTGRYFSPPNHAVPVEVGMAVQFPGTWHVDGFTFAYATAVPEDGTGVIDVVVNFYGGLALDDGPDLTTPVLSLELNGLPGAVGSTNAYVVGPVDLAGSGIDFDWPASTSQDGYENFNWVTFTFRQPRTGPVLAFGEVLLSSFWTGTDLNPPFEPGSFFWSFTGDLPPAFYLQLSGYGE